MSSFQNYNQDNFQDSQRSSSRENKRRRGANVTNDDDLMYNGNFQDCLNAIDFSNQFGGNGENQENGRPSDIDNDGQGVNNSQDLDNAARSAVSISSDDSDNNISDILDEEVPEGNNTPTNEENNFTQNSGFSNDEEESMYGFPEDANQNSRDNNEPQLWLRDTVVPIMSLFEFYASYGTVEQCNRFVFFSTLLYFRCKRNIYHLFANHL